LPRDPRDGRCQLKYWPTLVRITFKQIACQPYEEHFQQLSRFIPRPGTFAHARMTHPCTRHNCSTSSIRCRACHQRMSIRWILLMSSQPKLWSTNVDCHHCCWWHRVYSASTPSWTRTTVADGHKSFKQQKWHSRSLNVTR